MNTDEKLKEYKEILRERKAAHDEAKGALEYQFGLIKKEFDVKTMQEFEEKVAEWKRNRSELREKFDQGVKDLEKDYQWN